MSNNCEEKETAPGLFAAPATKLTQALKRAERFTEEKEAHKAQRELIQCTALTRIIYGNRHWKLAQALANLAHSYLVLQGLPVQAMQHANSAKRIIFSGGSTPPPASSEERREILSILVTVYYTLGIAHLKQKNGKESHYNLLKAKNVMEELKGLDWSGTPELKVPEKYLIAALGRACFQQNKVELAVKYFKKAINAVISAEGEMAPELINLYKKIAQIEQVRKKDKSIGYLLQAYSIVLAVHKKFSTEAASVALLLGKAFAETGEEKYAENAETYFSESLAAYKVALGMDHPWTRNALKDFSKWLIRAGKREQAYDLLEESFQCHLDPCSDFNEKATDRFYIMACICLAEGKMKKAYQLFSKCVQIQEIVYGSRHRKTKEIQKLLDVLKSPAVAEETRHMKPRGKVVLTHSYA